ncbi:MAG TPA: cell division ATP-binding protein FtsE [Syntrophaceae bacterium]|nr:cell division ATP-binding protein FtsE [Syntrophaceae bacterium]
MLQMLHVYKSYEPGHMVLHDINLSIDKGDFLFITGPSGAGKTTLLKLIFLEERVTKGQILMDGTSISNIHPSKIPHLRRRMGIVLQDFKLLLNRTVFENVALSLEILGHSKSYVRKKVMHTLREVNLSHKFKILTKRLSYGEQQKVAIARAMVNNPFLLLADEPCAYLDSHSTHEIIAIFEHINAWGTTILFATHNQKLVDTVGKKSVRLNQGRIIN